MTFQLKKTPADLDSSLQNMENMDVPQVYNMLQCIFLGQGNQAVHLLTLTVLVTTIDAQWKGMGDVGSARYEPALLPPCATIRVLSY